MESSRTPAAVVFVSVPGDVAPYLVVRPPAIAEVIRADPVLSDGWVPSLPTADARPARSIDRLAAALPHRRGYAPLAGGDPVDRPVPAALVGATGWLATQTFWVGGGGSGLWAARRWRFAVPRGEEPDVRFEAVSTALSASWAVATGVPASATPLGFGARRDWDRLGVRSFPKGAWLPVGAERADGTPEPRWAPEPAFEPARTGHAVVLGASGAGKTCFLAEQAARSIARGEPVVAIDIHGDLAPAVLGRLARSARARVVALDLSSRPVPGISAISPTAPPDRAAAHLVAALKRLTPDGGEVYWGFRLERILDASVRLAQESGGSLLDVYALLTDPDRRDAARLATRAPDLARFLEELGPIVRRTPDFLWAATSRLAKVVAVPSVAELLAPADGGLPVEDLLESGRSILIRLPFALLGPEAAAFAGTLVLARLYLGAAARRSEGTRAAATTVVLDEVQGLSPRLVSEMLAEGRKFGFRLLVATQFPDRLSPELRASVAGVVRDFVAFRIPRPGVVVAGGWLGLSPADSERWLVDLPPGHGIARVPDDPLLRPIRPAPPPSEAEGPAWTEAVRATRAEFRPGPSDDPGSAVDDAAAERLLLAVLASEEEGSPLRVSELVDAAGRLPGPWIDPAALSDRVRPLERQGYLTTLPDGVYLTAAGERRLGLGAPSGASRESAEHRGLILRTFRLFARRGHLLEVVRQGRFDTRLPDARYRQIPERLRNGPPAELSAGLDRIRSGWAWRFFGGMDVHVEAEVSGALRPARIRHGLSKARARGAYALFVVTDGRRAGRVRVALRGAGVGRDRAQVWTLSPTAAAEERAERPQDPRSPPGVSVRPPPLS
jgi:hypothetical protein